MYALISPLEELGTGERIADIVVNKFDVAPPLHWVELLDTSVTRDTHYYDTSTNTFKLIPVTKFVASTPIPTPSKLTPLQFIDRFTDAEQLAIVTATMQVPAIKLWYDKLIASTEVIESDPRTHLGLQAMVAAGLITAERAAVILPPSTASIGVTIV